jgi:hypothetical protein
MGFQELNDDEKNGVEGGRVDVIPNYFGKSYSTAIIVQ